MNEHTLVERLNIPWPEHDTEEVTLPAWVIELCAEGAARITALEAQLAELAVENEQLKEALEQIEQQLDYGQNDTALHIARRALEGGK